MTPTTFNNAAEREDAEIDAMAEGGDDVAVMWAVANVRRFRELKAARRSLVRPGVGGTRALTAVRESFDGSA